MKSLNKVLVGIFVIGCLALFAVGLFLIGNSSKLFSKSVEVYADFTKITGVANGGKVRVSGMDAGTVTRIDVPLSPEGKFRVHFRVIETLHTLLREDSVATIQTDGLLGNKYLEIEAGTSPSPLARNNSQIKATEPFDWGDLMDEISTAAKQVNTILSSLRPQLVTILDQVERAVASVNSIIKGATPEVKSILASAHRIADNIRAIIEGVESGQGTIGGLFKDQDLYASLRRSVDKTEHIVEDVREVTRKTRGIVDKVEASDIVPEVQKTVKNLQEITVHVKEAVEKFQAAGGEGGLGESLQRTLADAHEAMSDLSDDTEALKHNFFLRGFFNRRGFFDLGALTTPEYKSSNFGKGFKRHRIFIENDDLFAADSKGVQNLTPAGKARLDEAMTELLTHPRNGPLMIEGFTGSGTAAQQFLTSRRRATRVQAYLIDRFHLRPAYVGLVAMGAEPIPAGLPGQFREGVAIVSFYK